MIEPGTILDERYELTQTLGEGGMANVYLAYDRILDREVAVKVLRLDLQNDPDTLRRFRREAMATLELAHPNIVNIYDVGETNGQQYLVMEYVKGTDLKKYIALNFPIPYARVIALMTQILSAVQTAHDHHIIHRDLKPLNVLVDENGTAKITDFGIAVALSDNSMTQTNSLLGSVHYLSPEQARGGMPTRQSDIYALGIILYEMLTGSVPFEGESAVSIALKHFQQAIPSVRDFDPRIPQALENVVLKATAKDPSQRYTSASAMNADLATALDESRAKEPKFNPDAAADLDATKVITPVPTPQPEPTTAAKATTTQTPVQKPKRRWRKRYTLGIILLVMLLTGGIALAFMMPKGDVAVPDVLGMSQSQATSALTDKKLKLGDVTQKYSTKYTKGEVMAVSPNVGTSVKSASLVDLVISKGVKKFKVGNYEGEQYDDVKTDLEARGFIVESEEEFHSSGNDGQIISQDIDPGTKVNPKNKRIKFVVTRVIVQQSSTSSQSSRDDKVTETQDDPSKDSSSDKDADTSSVDTSSNQDSSKASSEPVPDTDEPAKDDSSTATSSTSSSSTKDDTEPTQP